MGQVKEVTHQLMSQDEQTQLLHLLPSQRVQGNEEWELRPLHNSSYLLLFPPYTLPLLQCGVLPRIQSLMNFSNMDPLHQMQPFKNRLLQVGHAWATVPARKPAPVWASLHSSRRLLWYLLSLHGCKLPSGHLHGLQCGNTLHHRLLQGLQGRSLLWCLEYHIPFLPSLLALVPAGLFLKLLPHSSLTNCCSAFFCLS